ncbi:MAG: hypothetical protein EB060_09520 [Proteobacteria bacterium]|nr:hypothetical protein [Pseudomonadota bacterium]
MNPPIPVMTEEEYQARYGSAGSSLPVVPPTPPVIPQAPLNIPVMDEAEYTRRYGSMGDNAIRAIKDIPSGLYNAPKALVETGVGTVGAIDALAGGEQLAPEERQALRNVGSIAAATAGGLAGAQGGAMLGASLGPIGMGAGGLIGGAVGGGLGLLGIDWFAEKQGVDAPRTDKERLNDLAYNVTGGVGGDLALRGLGTAAKGVTNPIKRTFTEAGQVEAAANVANKIYGDNAVVNLLDNEGVLLKREPLSQYKTTADVLGTEGAAQLQKQLQMEQFGDPIGEKLVAREAARKEMLQSLAPEDASIARVQQNVSDQIDALRYTAGAADRQLGPSIDPTSAGAGIREIAELLYGRNREGVREAFQSIPQSEVKRFTPSSDLLTATDRLKELFGPGSEGAPSELKRMVETLNPELKPAAEVDPTTRMLQEISGKAPKEVDPRLSLDYLQRLRRWGGEAATKYFNKGENRSGSVAQAVVKDIDEGLNQAVENGTMPPEQAAAYKSALTAHKEMAQTFERGPMGRILRRGEGVEGYNIEPSAVAKQFWKSNPEAMKSFSKALGGNVQARELLVRDAITDFRAAASNVDGGFKPYEVKKWMTNHEPLLNMFPDMKQAVRDIYVNEAKRALKTENFSKFVEANPEQAASVLLSGKDSARTADLLLRDIKDRPDLLQGVRRGIIDKLHDDLYSIADLSAKPATFKRFMDKNESVLKKYFDKDQVTALERIYGDMASEVRTEELAKRGSIGNSVTAQKGSLKQQLQTLIQNEFGTVGNILRNGGKVGTVMGGAIGLSEAGVLGGMVGGSIGGSVGAKVTNMITRAENAAMRELAKAAADPAVALKLLSKSTSTRKNVIRQVLEKKMDPIRQILVSGYIGTREDDNKLAEDMASLLPQNRLMAAPTPTPTQAADLANALSQNGAGALLQQPAAPTMSGNRAMSDNESKQGRQPAADVDLTPRNVAPELVDAVVMQESSGRANAVGPNTKYGTAKGLMQLLDSTGKEMHAKLGLKGKYDPFDAEQNRLIGTAYLDELVGRYDNNVPLGLAAYNWGMGNLERAFDKLGAKGPAPVQAMMEQAVRDGMKSGMSERQAKRAAAAQVVDTFGIEVLNPYMPDETRNYVRKIMNRYQKTKNSIVEA